MDETLLTTSIETSAAAARLAGEVILNKLGRLGAREIEAKRAFDFVTEVDRKSESVIIETIRKKFPSHSFLAEETLKQPETGDYRWIIDPLDGTTNYIHGYPMFSVSIALQFGGEIISAVVFDPLRDELFQAVRGGGAFLNGQRLRVSQTALEKSLVATGFPFRKKEMTDLYLKAFRMIFLEVSDIRRAGSAALDLAYVAAGRLDGFFELNLSPWDIAAGSLLITEAGGIITDFAGTGDFLSTGNVVAGNPSIQPQILEKITEAFKDVVKK